MANRDTRQTAITRGLHWSGRAWLPLAAGLVGLLLLLVILYSAVSTIRSVVDGVSGTEVPGGVSVSTWEEAASRHQFVVYRPAYVPDALGEPELSSVQLGELIAGVDAEWPEGLVISQTGHASKIEASAQQVEVQGAQEAYVDTVEGQQVLIVRKKDTWLTLFGLPQDELRRVAGELQPVQVRR